MAEATCTITNCGKRSPAGEAFCADHRDTREEIAHGRTIDQRDAAEQALSQSYYLVTGRSPEWSSVFGYPQALEEIEDACTTLRLEIKRLRGHAGHELVTDDACLLLERLRTASRTAPKNP